MDRRYFMMSAAAAASARSMRASVNDRGRVACIGVRSQGNSHLNAYSKLSNVEVAAICDLDESMLAKRRGEVEKRQKNRPARFTDFRKVLEDKSIDAVSIATPNHLHALIAITACQAGKDVYVEKPCSHNIFEARHLLAAARKYDRMVQHGTNSRSTVGCREAMQELREGLIGDVYLSRGLCFKWRDTIGRTPDAPV